VFHFVRGRCGFELVNLTSTNSLRNNEYLFRRLLKAHQPAAGADTASAS
jgi:hypothetical protein